MGVASTTGRIGPTLPTIRWTEKGVERSGHFRSENAVTPPASCSVIDDRISGAQALARLSKGEALLYRGDFRNARQLLSAVERKLEKQRPVPRSGNARDQFFADREAKASEAKLLAGLVVALDDGYRVLCDKAPDVTDACQTTWGLAQQVTVVSLRELLGVMGAHEWRKKGIPVKALGGAIHPHYGVFGPVRQEYVELVAGMPELSGKRVFDVGTGTGVLAILAAKKGAAAVLATDLEPRAVECALQNVRRFGANVSVEECDLLPEGAADVILFNPPWLPAKPKTSIDRAIYDEGGLTLRRFFERAQAHLTDSGVVWLVISDLAERIGIRRPGLLEQQWTAHGLRLRERFDAKPTHKRTKDAADPLHEARAGETTTLYVLERDRG